MYEVINDYYFAESVEHGGHVQGAVHLFVEEGDPLTRKDGWLVCRKCAEQMDRNPLFKEKCPPAFEEFSVA